MKKALIVATIYEFIAAFEQNNIKILKSMGYEVWCACNTIEANGQLKDLDLHIVDIPFGRNPLCRTNVKAYKMLKKLIRQENFDLVHCHTPVGGAIGRLAAFGKVSKIIYTAHGFHFYTGAPNINWLIYYPIEKWLARKTDLLITINQEDYQRAKKYFKARAVKFIPGVGIDINKIQKIVQAVDKKQKRRELGIPEDALLLLSVGELSVRKNHIEVIKALEKLSIKKNKIYYIICGKGNQEKLLTDYVKRLGLIEEIHFLGYRTDVIEIMAISDLFLFPSKQEGLPVALMEAMATGSPCLASNIRGSRELIKNELSCSKLFSLGKQEELIDGIHELVKVNKEKVSVENLKILQKYSSQVVIEKMTSIYSQI